MPVRPAALFPLFPNARFFLLRGRLHIFRALTTVRKTRRPCGPSASCKFLPILWARREICNLPPGASLFVQSTEAQRTLTAPRGGEYFQPVNEPRPATLGNKMTRNLPRQLFLTIFKNQKFCGLL